MEDRRLPYARSAHAGRAHRKQPARGRDTGPGGGSARTHRLLSRISRSYRGGIDIRYRAALEDRSAPGAYEHRKEPSDGAGRKSLAHAPRQRPIIRGTALRAVQSDRCPADPLLCLGQSRTVGYDGMDGPGTAAVDTLPTHFVYTLGLAISIYRSGFASGSHPNC